MSKNSIFLHTCCFCNNLKKGTLFSFQPINRQHILLHIILITAVYLTIHMNGQIWNHQHILLHCHQLLTDFSIFFHDQTPCHRKRSVKPRSQKRSPIKFHIQLYIAIFHHLRILFDLQRGGIAVTCNNVKHITFRFRKCKGDQC